MSIRLLTALALVIAPLPCFAVSPSPAEEAAFFRLQISSVEQNGRCADSIRDGADALAGAISDDANACLVVQAGNFRTFIEGLETAPEINNSITRLKQSCGADVKVPHFVLSETFLNTNGERQLEVAFGIIRTADGNPSTRCREKARNYSDARAPYSEGTKAVGYSRDSGNGAQCDAVNQPAVRMEVVGIVTSELTNMSTQCDNQKNARTVGKGLLDELRHGPAQPAGSGEAAPANPASGCPNPEKPDPKDPRCWK